ncbi:MAG: cyclase family protein [Actinobacteria bacterium]|nr:cyclase family protein [Actinomycetota bacterium]
MPAGQADDPIADLARRYSNWGRWGEDDELGTLNLIGPERLRAAADLVATGETVSLCLPFSQDGPQRGANGRFNCLRYSTSTGADHAAGLQRWNGAEFPHGVGFADDTVVLHLHSGTHWDGLAHVFHEGQMYNGFAATAVSAEGASRCGLETLADRVAGRGVLLDLPAALGVEYLEDGFAITDTVLDLAAEFGGVEIEPGDVLLIRTGQMGRCLREGWGEFAGGAAPGLSLFTVPWLAERQVAAVATDTWGVEVRPNELVDSYQPFHIVSIVYMGLLLGEMFQLDQLARQCAARRRYQFMIVAPPVPFRGAAGGPGAPVAIF